MKIQNVRLKLVRENIGEYRVNEFTIESPKTVVKVIEDSLQLREEPQEHFVVMFLDNKNKVIGLDTISIGTVNATLVSPREIFIKALMINSVSIILCHNHPSGNSTPSKEDEDVTKRVVEAGKIIGVGVLDHIIIGQYNHYSFKEYGLIS